MRIATGGIATECCTFSPLPTRLEDFRIWEGDRLLDSYLIPRSDHEIEWLPTLTAKAIPGGPVTADAYEELKGRIIAHIANLGEIDGFFLDLHGAMNVSGMDDAEGDLAEAIRNAVGPEPIIGASMDLHGNVSPKLLKNIDLMSAYRTAPHIDANQTRRRTVKLIADCIVSGIRPVIAQARIPVALPGERTSTEWGPGMKLWSQLFEEDKADGILECSLFVGYAWADEPRMTACAVVSGTDEAAVAAAANRVARRYWDARNEFDFGVPTYQADEAVRWALNQSVQPVIISDSGDNPTAGGAGDTPIVLEALLKAGADNVLVAGIADEPAAKECAAAGPGATLDLELGGKLDPIHATPLKLEATVVRVYPDEGLGGIHVVLKTKGVTIMLTEKRRPFHHIKDFIRLGIDIEDYKVVSVKVGYLVPELKDAAREACLALTEGAVDQYLERRDYKRIERPMFPFDREFDWSPIAQLIT
jgi:microcystin degradation protein MlrC